MTGLLISVRDRDEAEAASRGGADLIDIKEPSTGSLGAAKSSVWRDVLEVVPNSTPVSVALGELMDDGFADRLRALRAYPQISYAKVGLANSQYSSSWSQRWTQFRDGIPAETRAVAVAYADWQLAHSISPMELLRLAVELEFPTILIDTFDKTRGKLLDYMSQSELTRFIQLAREHQITTVIGGSLSVMSIPAVLVCQPNYIAVRGAACAVSRDHQLKEKLVRELALLVHGEPSQVAPH